MAGRYWGGDLVVDSIAELPAVVEFGGGDA